MSQAKHTPAPWEVRDGDPAKENEVAFVRGLTVFGPYKAVSAIADARLIAAAPEMLTALRDIVSLFAVSNSAPIRLQTQAASMRQIPRVAQAIALLARIDGEPEGGATL